jgi:hypothetical protein
MFWLTFFVLFMAPALFFASREEEEDEDGMVQIAVHARNLQRTHGANASTLAELRAGSQHAKRHVMQLHVDTRPHAQSAKSEEKVGALTETSQNASLDSDSSLRSSVEQTTAGLMKVGSDAAQLRKMFQELLDESGINEAAELSAAEKQQAEVAKAGAKRKLEELAIQKKQVLDHADALDRKMNTQYAELLGTKVSEVASLLQSGTEEEAAGKTLSEDEMFAQLEKQTNTIVQWFAELKSFRQQRDELKARRQAAEEAASKLGLSAERVKVPPKTEAVKSSNLQMSPADVAAKHKNLAAVMASSAMEMAQIKKASDDVMVLLDEMTEWRRKQDTSPTAVAEAAKIQAKLSKAMDFLKEHENTVNARATQINALMKDVGMKQPL